MEEKIYTIPRRSAWHLKRFLLGSVPLQFHMSFLSMKTTFPQALPLASVACPGAVAVSLFSPFTLFFSFFREAQRLRANKKLINNNTVQKAYSGTHYGENAVCLTLQADHLCAASGAFPGFYPGSACHGSGGSSLLLLETGFLFFCTVRRLNLNKGKTGRS